MEWNVDVEVQARMLQNRLAKTFRKLAKPFERAQIGAFRLYDRDIPEIRLAIDWYEGHLVVAEYERRQHEAIPQWAARMAQAAAQRLEVPPERVHLKQRRTRPQQGPRYGRLARSAERLIVREGELRFWVNLTDYLDSGLFLDQRLTRARVGQESQGRHVLNLYGYTGSFTCAAALGGAASSVTIDRSRTYTEWAQDNLALNGLAQDVHRFVVCDSRAFLERAQRGGQLFDLIVCDPPSFSTAGQDVALDIQRDHPQLVEACLAVLKPGGVLWFCTNHQRFTPALDALGAQQVEEMTVHTVPQDFRNRTVHRSFRIRK